MTKPRLVIAALIVGLGSLQAWEAQVPAAGAVVVGLVALALLVPAVAALLGARPTPALVACLVSAGLLLLARRCSEDLLPALLVVPALAWMLLLGGWAWSRRRAHPGER